MVFIDVDLYDSILCCLENLYPILQEGCEFFTHEARSLFTIKAFSNKELWKKLGEEKPPRLVGALTGLGLTKPFLAYIIKPKKPKSSHSLQYRE